MSLSPDIGLTGPIPKRHPLERTSGTFFLDSEGRQPDPFEDEQALWIRTSKGLVVVLGCGHAGLVNTLEYVLSLTGESTILAVLGGLHLLNASEERLQFTVEVLKRLGVEALFPCHCSGETEVAYLRTRLGSRVRPLAAGGQCFLDPLST